MIHWRSCKLINYRFNTSHVSRFSPFFTCSIFKGWFKLWSCNLSFTNEDPENLGYTFLNPEWLEFGSKSVYSDSICGSDLKKFRASLSWNPDLFLCKPFFEILNTFFSKIGWFLNCFFTPTKTQFNLFPIHLLLYPSLHQHHHLCF